MVGGLNRLLVAALVAGAVFVFAGPPAALGCNGGPSAVNVYKECLPTGGGGKATSGSPTHGSQAHGSQAHGSQTSTSTNTVPVSSPAARVLKHAGKDRRVLTSLVHGYGLHRVIRASAGSGTDTAPTALGSAFDLGSGPTALLIVLAGTAVLLISGSGIRVWRNRRRA